QNQKIHFPDGSWTIGSSYQDSMNHSVKNENLKSGNYVRNLGWDWSIKANATYGFPHNVTVSAYFELVNGLVVPIWNGSPVFGNYAEGRSRKPVEALDTANLNVVNYMDLKIQKDFALREYGKLSISADIFNIFNVNPTQA